MVWECCTGRPRPPGKSGPENNSDIPLPNKIDHVRLLLSCLLLLACLCLRGQDLSVFEAFTDHAVLQREVAHPVWGWARPRRNVRVTLNGDTYRTKTDREGKWRVTLPAQQAGGPHRLVVTDGRASIELDDIYFGDVYLLSGQSNMEWRLSQSDPDSTRALAIADPLIRQILVTKAAEEAPQQHLPLDESWKAGTKSEIADFSAVGSYFAHYLRESGVDVPIGLLHASWGGSRIEPWIPQAYQGENFRDDLESRRAAQQKRREDVLALYRREFGPAEPPVEEAEVNLSYVSASSPDGGWATTTLPGMWESKGYPDVDGVFYYRRTFDLTAQQAAAPGVLHLGPIDDNDQTYLNGSRVGQTSAYAEPRLYTLPTGALKEGQNTLVVRVTDTGGGGGFHGVADSMYLQTGTERIALSGDFQYRIAAFTMNAASRSNSIPTLLYNAMIAPLEDMPLTAVLWYQGESNAGSEDAPAYADQMEALVTSWREQFGDADLPFYWVQLANYMAPPMSADEPGWALLREQQTQALDIPHSGQAVITDIGEAGDIHPRNKWEVGRRLSLHARKDIYGQDVQASSPVAASVRIEGADAIVAFDEIGAGLTLRLREEDRYRFVRSLTVRDGAGDWHWAIGTLGTDGQTIRVVNPAGTGITAVRYAWSNNPDDANLFSRDGLPVTPFELVVD